MNRLIPFAALVALPSLAAAQAVTVTLTEWKLSLRDTVRAGPLTFRLNNTGVVAHAFHVKGEGVDRSSREVGPKQTGTLTLTLKPGTYDVYCPMAEETHMKAGMARKLVVVAADSAAAKPPQR